MGFCLSVFDIITSFLAHLSVYPFYLGGQLLGGEGEVCHVNHLMLVDILVAPIGVLVSTVKSTLLLLRKNTTRTAEAKTITKDMVGNGKR